MAHIYVPHFGRYHSLFLLLMMKWSQTMKLPRIGSLHLKQEIRWEGYVGFLRERKKHLCVIRWKYRKGFVVQKKHLCLIRWKYRKGFFVQKNFFVQKKHLCVIRWIVAVKGCRDLGCQWKRAYLKVHVFKKKTWTEIYHTICIPFVCSNFTGMWN